MSKLPGSPLPSLPLSLTSANAILEDISYLDWRFDVLENGEDLYLQLSFEDACVKDPARGRTLQKSRKWRLSRHSTKSEVVQTALMAVLTAIEHEAREHFTFKGRSVFGPHFDVESLVNLCDERHLDVRLAPDGTSG